jgi:hypothetical protein
MKIHTVYQITNIINNDYYIGVHKTENPMDSYYGSGILIERSIKKYGRENFQKKILFIFDNSKDAYEKEKDLLLFHLSNPECLNLSKGGVGGANFKGKTHSIETKNKLADLAKRKPGYKKTKVDLIKEKETRLKLYGQFHSENCLKKISTENLGRISITNGIERKRIKSSDPIPTGWRQGWK